MLAKVLLQPLSRLQLKDYEGVVLYRTSGMVKIFEITPVKFSYYFLDGPRGETVDSYNGTGFYRPILFVTEPNFDASSLHPLMEGRFLPLRLSEYEKAKLYLPQADGIFKVNQSLADPSYLRTKIGFNGMGYFCESQGSR